MPCGKPPGKRETDPVYVRINEIQKGTRGWITFDTTEEFSCSDLDFAGPVSVSLKLTNAETRVLVQGNVNADVKLECARCNEEFLLPLDVEIEEGFVPEDSPEADASGLDAYEVLTYKEDRLPLDEMLRQNFLAAVPMQPVCRGGECKGMCDQCGCNLDTDSCDCKKNDIDPRWAALGELKKKSSKPSLN